MTLGGDMSIRLGKLKLPDRILGPESLIDLEDIVRSGTTKPTSPEITEPKPRRLWKALEQAMEIKRKV